MKIQWLAPVCALVVLSGCTASPSREARAPGVRIAPPAAHVARNNRFDMTQNGRHMTADDFDAWMKARGIRVVQGAPARKRPAPALEARSDRRTKRR